MIFCGLNILNLKRAGLLCLALFCQLFIGTLYGQTDSLNVAPIRVDATHTKVVSSEHSANKALLLSAILPGAGQIYNRQAWKVPIVYAAFGGIGYFTVNNYRQMKTYKDEYLYRVNNNDSYHDADLATTPTANIYNLYQNYNQTFQLSVILTVAVYGLNLLDAYVFGHLFDFQITDDLSMNVTPMLMSSPYTKIGGTFSVSPAWSLSLRF